jgi:hypothetical protein
MTRPVDRFLPIERQMIAGGSGAITGSASISPRRTYFGRTVRRRKKRAGS